VEEAVSKLVVTLVKYVKLAEVVVEAWAGRAIR
jgi:hypothetical protein